ncbi:MAG: P27 family phage terminase small subunit [Bacillota bacterium]|nr:P27 family phage terminase small subunit [Bacillota bacterium]
MATNVVAFENTRKHFTKAEKQARETAEKDLTRKVVKLKKPVYLKENKEAAKYWNQIIKQMDEITLLDNLDSDILGRYCVMAARLDTLNERINNATHIDDDLLRRIEATERNILSYAEKLGLTPTGRFVLPKKEPKKTKLTRMKTYEEMIFL